MTYRDSLLGKILNLLDNIFPNIFENLTLVNISKLAVSKAAVVSDHFSASLPQKQLIEKKRIYRKHMQASWLISSRPINFFSNGCFRGSLEYFHNSSGLRRLAVDRVLVSVLLGGGLQLAITWISIKNKNKTEIL